MNEIENSGKIKKKKIEPEKEEWMKTISNKIGVVQKYRTCSISKDS